MGREHEQLREQREVHMMKEDAFTMPLLDHKPISPPVCSAFKDEPMTSMVTPPISPSHSSISESKTSIMASNNMDEEIVSLFTSQKKIQEQESKSKKQMMFQQSDEMELRQA